MVQQASPTSPRKLRGRLISCEITRREDLTEDLWKIWLEPSQPFKFKPGQYCTIGAEDIERPYSIVSSPNEAEIELFIELVPPPDGNLTPVLHKLDVGATLTLRPRAKGIFVFKPEYKNHLMIGTVTGTVPYVSMLRNHEEEGIIGDFNYYVLEGASYQDEFGYDEEISGFANKYQNVEFVPSCSRPDEARNDGWQGERGRINTLFEKYVEHFGLDPSDTCVYACGHPQMIEDVKVRGENAGFHVEEERFWKEDD